MNFMAIVKKAWRRLVVLVWPPPPPEPLPAPPELLPEPVKKNKHILPYVLISEKTKKSKAFDDAIRETVKHGTIDEYERNRRSFDKFLPRPKPPPRPRSPKPIGSLEEELAAHDKKMDALKAEMEKPPQELSHGDPLILHPTADGRLVKINISEFRGEFNFRDTILDQLDRYFVYLKRMKKRDKDSFKHYRQVGATLMPFAALSWERLGRGFGHEEDISDLPLSEVKLPPFFVKTLPAFGCVAYGTDSITEDFEQRERHADKPRHRTWIPKFIYFTKYKLPPMEMQPFPGGAIYKVTVWWDKAFDKSMSKKLGHAGTPQDFGIAVAPDGSVHALKHRESEEVRIVGKVRQNGKRIATFTRRRWTLPDIVDSKEGESRSRRLERLFCDAAHWHEGAAMSMFRVSIKKGGLTATFGVNPLRAPYFFADRDLMVDEQGKRVPIFHIVRPHQREIGEGKTASVREHFRGARQFGWAGYDCLITVPGLHHHDWAACDIGALDKEAAKEMKIKSGLVSSEAFAKIIADDIEGKRR